MTDHPTPGRGRPAPRRAVAPPRLPPAVDRRDRQPVRHVRQPARAAAGRDPGAARDHVRGRPARRRCEMLAFLVVGLPAGAWVDRMRFRWVLIVNDLVRAVALGSIPLAQLPRRPDDRAALRRRAGHRRRARCSSTSPTSPTCRRSSIARRWSRATRSCRRASRCRRSPGPGVGGLLIQALTAPYAILVDAVSFLWSASWVARDPGRVRRSRNASPTAIWAARSSRGCGSSSATGCCARSPRAPARPTCSTNVAFAGLSSSCWRASCTCRPASSACSRRSRRSAACSARWSRRGSRARFGQGPTIWISIACQHPAGVRRAVRAPRLDARAARRRAARHVGRGGRLQHHPGQLPPGPDAGTAARPDERDDALLRVGHDPARRVPRRRARVDDRRPADAAGRRDRRVAGRAAGVLLAAAHACASCRPTPATRSPPTPDRHRILHPSHSVREAP